METERIRKQIYDLTLEDLRRWPVWEFALDEEGEPGQDEATCRPRSDLKVPDPQIGSLVTFAEFTAADGTSFAGLAYVDPTNDLGTTQPAILTPRGHVSFWGGILGWERAQMNAAYETLGKRPEQLFPLQFRYRVAGEKLRSGVIPGFLTLEDWKTGQVKVSR